MTFARIEAWAARDRYRAAAAHLAATLAVALAVAALMYFRWYPKGLFTAGKGIDLLRVITGVAIAIGPLLTLVAYSPGKKGLKFDLLTIAALQIASLMYGMYVLGVSRPAYIVLIHDRFELVRANEILAEDLEKARATPYAEIGFEGPRVVGARLPIDPREMDRVFDAAMAGVDLHHFPQHFVAYESVAAGALSRAGTIERLRKLNPSSGPRIDKWVAGTGRPEKDLRFLPLRDGPREMTALVDAHDGELLGIALLAPWES